MQQKQQRVKLESAKNQINESEDKLQKSLRIWKSDKVMNKMGRKMLYWEQI